MNFDLDDTQLEKLNQWKTKIKELFGEYGMYDYIFTPTGIGVSVKVYSHITRTELDLTDVDNW